MRKSRLILITVAIIVVLGGLGVVITGFFMPGNASPSETAGESLTNQEVPELAEDMQDDISTTEYKITEGVLLSDEDITKLCDAIASKNAITSDEYASLRGTGELDLSVAGPIPVYWFYDTGEFKRLGSQYLVFDGDKPILRVDDSLNNEDNSGVIIIDESYYFDDREWDTFEDIIAQSTTKEFAIIGTADGYCLYDGVNAVLFRFNPISMACGKLAENASDTPGIDVVELAGINVRQHFDY